MLDLQVLQSTPELPPTVLWMHQAWTVLWHMQPEFKLQTSLAQPRGASKRRPLWLLVLGLLACWSASIPKNGQSNLQQWQERPCEHVTIQETGRGGKKWLYAQYSPLKRSRYGVCMEKDIHLSQKVHKGFWFLWIRSKLQIMTEIVCDMTPTRGNSIFSIIIMYCKCIAIAQHKIWQTNDQASSRNVPATHAVKIQREEDLPWLEAETLVDWSAFTGKNFYCMQTKHTIQGSCIHRNFK